jgi:hypothetical protein
MNDPIAKELERFKAHHQAVIWARMHLITAMLRTHPYIVEYAAEEFRRLAQDVRDWRGSFAITAWPDTGDGGNLRHCVQVFRDPFAYFMKENGDFVDERTKAALRALLDWAGR